MCNVGEILLCLNSKWHFAEGQNSPTVMWGKRIQNCDSLELPQSEGESWSDRQTDRGRSTCSACPSPYFHPSPATSHFPFSFLFHLAPLHLHSLHPSSFLISPYRHHTHKPCSAHSLLALLSLSPAPSRAWPRLLLVSASNPQVQRVFSTH
jgi:hypothetical protein